ncbi:MAG: helix-turn-helix domain-containing protein [Mariprofundus sp.]|nr:helix-turn-helix domain-containing protein [Mariprofundus sp.]
MGTRKNAQLLLKHLYSKPAIMTNDVVELLGISHQVASALLKKMVVDGILVEVTGYHQRNRVFYFERYLTFFSD